MRIFENAPLVRSLMARGPVVEVRVEIEAASTPSAGIAGRPGKGPRCS